MKLLKRSVILGAMSMAMAMPAIAEKWDMPMAYSGSNFHSVTGAEFAKCVTTGTGGDIEIVTHPSGSLFPGAQIKRAIQSGQVPIGERLLSGHQKHLLSILTGPLQNLVLFHVLIRLQKDYCTDLK